MPTSGPIEVLHVDDDQDITELTATYLHREDERFDVQTATSASEGLTAVAENGFDCIVSDYDMPGQNGIEFLRAVRETDTELPFILYTGKGSEEVASEAIAAGVTDYLQKEGGSSQYEVLANRIRNAVGSQRATERAEDTEEWATTLLEYSSDFVSVVDEDGEVSYISPSVTRVLGYDPEELTGTDAFDSIHPDDAETVVESFAEILDRPNEDVTVEFRAEHSDGSHRWLEMRGRNLVDDPVISGVLVDARDITERKERERQMMEMKERYQTLLEAAPDTVFVAAAETGEIIEISDAAETLFEMPSDEIVGLQQSDLHPPEQAETYRQLFKEHAQRGGTVRRLPDGSPIHIETANGDHIPVEISIRTVQLPDGPVRYGIVRDISEQVERERQIEREGPKFQGVFEDSFDAMVIADDDGRSTDVNESATDLFGVSEDELLGRSIAEFAPEDFDFAEAWQEFQDSEKERGTFPLVRADGDERIVEFAATRDIVPGKHLSILRDVTERREREQELRHIKEEYETVFEAAQDALFLYDVVETDSEYEFKLRRSNPALEESSGLSSEDLRGATPREIVGEEQGAEVAANLRECVEAEEPLSYEEVLEMPSRTIDWRTNLAPVIKDGEVTQIVGVARDITDQKEREQELRNRTKQIQDVIDSVEGAMWIRNADREYEYMNQYHRDLFDIADDVEVAGKQFSDLLPVEVAEQFQKNDQQVYETEEPVEIQETVETDDGPIHFLTRIVPLFENGSVNATCGIAIDVTEQKTRERQLEQFADIVSHDLRNPLNVATGRLELASEECDSDHFDDIKRAHDRMAMLIDDLLALAQEGEVIADTTSVDLESLVESCWANVESAGTTLVADIERTVQADESRLEQVFENLIRNAIEHGGEDVTVTIGELENGFYVEDDGPGIPPEAREDIFEAGYSTTEDGTGFGLSIVQQIVEAHNWSPRVTEGADGGARFEITGVEFAAE